MSALNARFPWINKTNILLVYSLAGALPGYSLPPHTLVDVFFLLDVAYSILL